MINVHLNPNREEDFPRSGGVLDPGTGVEESASDAVIAGGNDQS